MTDTSFVSETEPSASAATQHHRGRHIAVGALVVLTAFSCFVSTVAVWAHGVLLNTDRWVEAVGPLADDPAVTDALATYLVDELVTVLDVEQLAEDALPDQADFLAAPLTNAVEGFVTDQVAKLLQTEEFRTFWIEANRFTHEQAVRLLRGEPGVVTVNDGEVTLNLLPFMARILQELDQFGILPDRFSAPDITRETPVAEANQELGDALGVDLKPDFGQIVVYQSDQLAAAQDAVAAFDDLVVAVVVLTVVLAIASLALSVQRRRTLLQLGLGVVAAFILAAGLVRATTNHVLGLITDEADRSAASSVVRLILDSLRDISRIVALVGLVIAAVAFFTGDSSWAVRTRRFVRDLLGRGEATADEAGTPEMRAVGWVDQHRDALRILGVFVAFVLLLLVDLTFGSLLVIAIGLAVYEVILALLPTHGAPRHEPAGGAPGDREPGPGAGSGRDLTRT
jgi:hypothetical protein